MEQFFRFNNLYRRFDIDDRYIMESGSVEPGSILAVRGVSGSGKSTLLKMLARLLTPHDGEVIYRGQHWHSYSPMEWRIRIHYVSQYPVLFDGSLEDNFRMPFAISSVQQKRSFNLEQVHQYMQELQLPPNMLGQEAQTLSGGEAARIALIRALLIEPEILLLDEPTAYLDSDSRMRVVRLLNKWLKENSERAIIMVSHKDEDIDELENVSVLTIGDL